MGGSRVTVPFAVLVPASMTEIGKRVHVELGGPPLHASDTLPVNPLTDMSVIV